VPLHKWTVSWCIWVREEHFLSQWISKLLRKWRITIFWNVTPCSLIGGYWRFGGTCYLHLQCSNYLPDYTVTPPRRQLSSYNFRSAVHEKLLSSLSLYHITYAAKFWKNKKRLRFCALTVPQYSPFHRGYERMGVLFWSSNSKGLWQQSIHDSNCVRYYPLSEVCLMYTTLVLL
jgi:hypothetical protein